MWPPWGKSGRRKIPTPNSSPLFSFRTFKDVLHLSKEEEDREKHHHHRKITVTKTLLRSCNSLPIPDNNIDLDPPPEKLKEPPQLVDTDDLHGGAEKRIVVYFTSLRVVRKTFEDCGSVRLILKGFRVSVDERDLSMDSGFLQELEGILGERVSLPRVFIGGRYIGGADEIHHLHETGELKKHLQGFPPACNCDSCGGYRFVLCNNCNGSHKCFIEEDEKGGGGGFKSCSNCNENGLIRCPHCCFPVLSKERPL